MNPDALFHVPDSMAGAGNLNFTSYYTPWDVARDGRFIMAKTITGQARSQASSIIVTENWLTEWKRSLKK